MNNVHNLPSGRRRSTLTEFDRPIDGGGDGPHPPDMEQRVAKLETDVGEIKDILKRLEPSLSRITVDLAELKGKISHMPTLWQIAGTMLAINAGIVAVAGLAVALLRHAG
ncbi:hypothetical protein [Azospirillum sp. B2RO_4]|uniref:hypothetical protein n=1 Tax=Azospirillum sp. B2RO_4 TaxID=3027796 RepID=UPI003DA868B8